MTYFPIVLEQIGVFIIYACIGVLAVKSGVLNRQGLNQLSKLITKVVLPLLIFTNTINGATREEFLSSLIILVIASVLYFALYWLAFGMSAVSGLTGNMRNVYRACVMFGNCGFMGIPIITALFPERGGMYVAIYSIVDQFILWTIGSGLAAPTGQTKKHEIGQICKKMVNPATVAIFAGVVFLLTGLPLPSFINTALTRTGAAATPLAMIYLGGMFCYIRIIDYLKKKEIYLMAVVKMILLPLGLSAILDHLPAVSSEIAVTVSLICALPTMTSVAMVAESQHGDSEYATGMIFATTLLSAATLPLVCIFL